MGEMIRIIVVHHVALALVIRVPQPHRCLGVLDVSEMRTQTAISVWTLLCGALIFSYYLGYNFAGQH